MEWQLKDLDYKNDGRPPNSKRLRVVLSVVAYVILGLYVWWQTTSLQRPTLPHEEMQAAAAAADASSALLPVSLELVLVVPPGVAVPGQLSPASIAQAVQQAFQRRQQQEVPVQLTVTVNTDGNCLRSSAAAAAAGGAGSCASSSSSSSHSPGSCSAAVPPCLSLSELPVDSSTTNKLQQQQLDDWLLQQQQQQPEEGGTSAAAAAGRYVLYLLPAAAAAAEGSSKDSSPVSLVVGRHRHAWTTYGLSDLAQQQPQQILEAAAAAAMQVLDCCFGLHTNSTVSQAVSARLPVSAAGHTQLSFSLLNAHPSAGHHFVWDFDAFERQHLQPIAASLAPVTHVSVESQVLQFTPAREPGRWSKKHQAFVVRQEQLPFFIDSEWAVESGRAVMQHELQPGSSSSHGSSSRSRPAAAAAGTPGSASAAAATAAATATVAEAAAAAAERAAVLESHVLHFLVYIPSGAQQPLLLFGPDRKPRDSNSLWIPSWGGLLVLNLAAAGQSSTQVTAEAPAAAVGGGVDAGVSNSSSATTTTTTTTTARPAWEPLQLQAQQYQLIAQVVVAQLQALFGVAALPLPSSSSAAAAAAAATSGLMVSRLPAGQSGFSAWQVDGLLRQRAAGDVLEAARVLGSLSKLVLELPNLEMPGVIGQQVQQALSDITLARQHIAAGNYHAAGAAAAGARAAAEAAFLHPAVLAQLNFPESHKLGVYMPLFLPVSVPLLQGLLTELQRYLRRQYRWRTQGM